MASDQTETPGTTRPKTPREDSAQATGTNAQASDSEAPGADSPWQSAFDPLAEPVWMMDAEGCIRRCNQAAQKLLGNQIIGRPCWEVVHGTAGRVPESLFPLACESRRRASADLAIGERWFRCTVDPLFDAGGNISGALHILWDVTEGKDVQTKMQDTNATLERRVAERTGELAQANQILRKNEQQLRSFIENAPMAAAMFDRQMRYLVVSRRWLSDYGLEGRKIIGRSHYEIFPDISEGWKALHQAGLAGQTLNEAEGKVVRADGLVQWLRWDLRPWYDTAGGIGGIVIRTENITAQKQAEAALREKEEKLRRLFATVADAVCVFDAQTLKFVEANDAALQMYGYTSEELQQITAMDLTAEPEASAASIAQVVPRQPSFVPLRWHRKKDGTVFPVEISASTFKLEGRTLFCGVVRDITQRKKAEEQLARDLDAMTRLQKLALLFVPEGDLAPVLAEVVETAIAIAGADFGNIQLPDAATGDLRIMVQRGFPEDWLKFWDSVAKGNGTCGAALERGERVIVEDVENSPIFPGGAALDIQRKAGVRAVQSTPLVSRSGKVLGMFSTHYKTPQRPDERALRLLDLLARQAADMIEHLQAGAALRESEDRFHVIATSTPDHLLVQDAALRYTMVVNPQLGLTEQDMIGKTDYDLLEKADAEKLTAIKRGVLETGRSMPTEFSLTSKKGELEHFEGSYVPKHNEQGEIEGLIGYFRNVTARKRAETALRESDRRLNEAQRVAHVGSWEWDAATDKNIVTDELCRIFGLPAGQPIPNFKDQGGRMYPHEAWVKLNAAVQYALRTGRGFDLGIEALRGGKRIWVNTRAEVVRNARGETIGLRGTVQDITERIRAEEALRRSEADLRGYFENVAFGAAQLDGQGRFIRVNDHLCEITGYSREELLGSLGPLDLDHPEDRRTERERVARLLRGESYDIEKRYVAKDGRVIWVRVNAAPILDEAGKFLRSAAVIEDITERRRMAEALQDASQLNQQIISDAKEGIIVYGPDLRYQVWNRWMEELTGLSAKEVLGRHPLDVFPFLREAGVIESVTKALAGKAAPVLDFPYPRQKSGRLGWATNSNSPLRNGKGEIIGVIGMVRDITERKRGEQMLQQTNRTLQAIRDCHEAILRADTELQLLKEVCRIIVEISGERMAWVGYADGDAKKTVRVAASAGVSKDYLRKLHISWANTRRGRGPAGMAIRTGRIYLCHDTLTDPNFAPWRAGARRHGYRSVLALPLKADDRCFGVLVIKASEPKAFDAAEQLLLTDLASDLAYGIAILRLRAERTRLENEVLKSIEREQERIGRDLHDGLCQLLVGAKYRCGFLERISAGQLAEARREAAALESILNQAIEQARGLARGLSPVKVTLTGLGSALRKLAAESSIAGGPRCLCNLKGAAKIQDQHTANHLYRIAQEALQNAIKHARAKNISITLGGRDGGIFLSIEDDGVGMPARVKVAGMGLSNMAMRASLIGGRLGITRRRKGGTVVTCEFSPRSRANDENVKTKRSKGR